MTVLFSGQRELLSVQGQRELTELSGVTPQAQDTVRGKRQPQNFSKKELNKDSKSHC